MASMAERLKRGEFKETEPIELWSKRLLLEETYGAFYYRTKVMALVLNQRITGFIERDQHRRVKSFTRTRYPRRKYGVADCGDCQYGLERLATVFNGRIEDDDYPGQFRVVLGLREGYLEGAREHAVAEVSSGLGHEFNVKKAEVYAVRPMGNDAFVYAEPAAVIIGPAGKERVVDALAIALGQERFSVENFASGLTYCVETPLCTEPDA